MSEIDTSAEAVERLALWALEASRYFSNRDTGGEDRAYWAGVANSATSEKLAATLRALVRERDEARAALEQMRAPYAIICKREWQAGAEAMREAARRVPLQWTDAQHAAHDMRVGRFPAQSATQEAISEVIADLPIPERPE